MIFPAKSSVCLKASAAGVGLLAILASGCGGGDDSDLPQLAPATSGSLQSCETLATAYSAPNTRIISATRVAAGTLQIAGKAIPEHCLISGAMYERVSAVDAQPYAIRFEVRLPAAWNGRFFYQGNRGLDGAVTPATGVLPGGGPLSSGLSMGFAVVSSDGGHTSAQNPLFGIDPVARLDYGYQAVEKITPVAKAIVAAAYGRAPDRSYFVGCSNGGRLSLVAAARFPKDFDGYIAGSSGLNLPQAAMGQLYAAQQWNTIDSTNAENAFSAPERLLVSTKILERCDALDGAKDGLVQDNSACQAAFDLSRDVPSCGPSGRNGACLTEAQKIVIKNVFTGPRNSAGTALYTTNPFDPGISQVGWGARKFGGASPTGLDSGAVAFVFQTPPADPATYDARKFALGFSMDLDAPKLFATSGIYATASMQYMPPPAGSLSDAKNRGAKLMIFHGASDGNFSQDDVTHWYDNLRTANGGDATKFARYYRIPGMGHCGDGPATDQFDMLTPLVNWVEKGVPPDAVIASARGVGNAGGVNAELPRDWAPARSRPLCAYPTVARYKGSGDVEAAESFSCQ